MPSPYEIQVAIADAVTAALSSVTPSPKVLPRNILDTLGTGNWANFHDTSGKIHGWIVSQSADRLEKAFSGYAEYAPEFILWQFHEYYTGNDSANSEEDFAIERELVKVALSQPLSAPLSFLEPPSFYEIGLFEREKQGNKFVHIAKGTVRITNNNTECA